MGGYGSDETEKENFQKFIGAGGDIWFALLEDDRMAVLTVQNPEGNSIRYDGPAGITAE